MSDGPEPRPYAIRQFEIDTLIPIEIFGLDVSFTTSAQAMVTTVLVVTLLMVLGGRGGRMIPGRLQGAVKMVYKMVADTVVGTAGPAAAKAIPFVFTLFIYILFGSLIGLTPVKLTFTSHIIVTLGLSLTVFVYMTALAIKTQGAGFLRHFLPHGTPLYLAPLIVTIELISYLFRPLTLGTRVFANILAGHMIIKLFADFCGMMTAALGLVGLGLTILPLALMAIMYAFEVLVFVVQAYIFVLLTSIYLRDALHGH
jgi:F-type H+-transporting ATPase subunit a